MTPTKILFLDIDGVLNSRRTAAAFGGYPHSFRSTCMGKFDDVAIALVRRLCAETDSAVVLSSDWRYDNTAHQVANAFDLPVVDVTPKLIGSRGNEINAWLFAHPEVATFAIVDDVAEMFDAHPDNFVQTNEAEGLSLANFVALKKILEGIQS